MVAATSHLKLVTITKTPFSHLRRVSGAGYPEPAAAAFVVRDHPLQPTMRSDEQR
jgi:hypothetical protein